MKRDTALHCIHRLVLALDIHTELQFSVCRSFYVCAIALFFASRRSPLSVAISWIYPLLADN
ncbi:hypothetical protein H6G04_34870 [Calothrix membranacea FACHB-236]|nr:hypothetical protein [Calothrix membranacea FACHB-236]